MTASAQKSLHGLGALAAGQRRARREQGLHQAAGDPRRGLLAAVVKGSKVTFKLGYSHPIVSRCARRRSRSRSSATLLTVSGHDRQQVGQVAAEIRDLRRPDVYKQKGIRYAGEHLRKKAGKAGAAK